MPSVDSEMKFGETTYRDPEEICIQLGHYYSALYSEASGANFDEEHYTSVKTQVETLKARHLDKRSIPLFSEFELSSEIPKLLKQKACGDDSISNEHLIHGGSKLRKLILILFNSMLKHSYITAKMKILIVITIFKGNLKRKDDSSSYRAITLMSSLLKLYERLLYTRLVISMSRPLHPLQGGFQKKMGCTMTSFVLQESINYAKENYSKLYVCFLDSKQAFDYVWHDGLFLKLHELGIDLYLWKTLVNVYVDLTSYMKFRGFKSRSFIISQGTRQGSVTSLLMFLCFINDLLNIL